MFGHQEFETDEEYIQERGSAFALATYSDDQWWIMRRRQEVQTSLGHILSVLDEDAGISPREISDMREAFTLLLSSINEQLALVNKNIERCYQLDCTGRSPGTQEMIKALGSTRSLEYSRFELRRVRNARNTEAQPKLPFIH